MRSPLPLCALATLLSLSWVSPPQALGLPPKKNPPPHTRFEKLSFQKNSKRCKRNYRIQIDTLRVLEAPPALKPLVEAQLQNWLRWALEAETSASSSPEVWAQEELQRYEAVDCEEYKEAGQTPWERTLAVKHFFEDERWLTLSFEFVAFEGGAHESRQKQFVTWEKETQTPLSLAALSPEPTPLLELAETEFRNTQKLKPEDAFEANGYWFDNGQFRLSEQFALCECGLLLYYNPYEVAAYAVGAIEVFIPMAKLKTLSKLPLPSSKPAVKAFDYCPYMPPPPPKPAPKKAPPAAKK